MKSTNGLFVASMQKKAGPERKVAEQQNKKKDGKTP